MSSAAFSSPLAKLAERVSGCTLCGDLPLGPRPVFQIGRGARILIAGQAPGARVHASGIPFDDASGNRLREWMGIDRETFYDPDRVAILPMGMCYPGTGKGGDLPPPPLCAPTWRRRLLAELPDVELTLVVGRYAHDWHFGRQPGTGVTDRVRNWRETWPARVPLPHPSPRNNRWLAKNPWFAADLLPVLKKRIRYALD